ncbi:hypothetical protein B1H10_01265 [candidate division KSB1 bacterium 4484_188]|nr:MAG: hypothetical protein B1H10_01265 [candidate division KSB1 bacterium 4484_188]
MQFASKKILGILFLFGLVLNLSAQQNVTLDWKMHDVGKVRQFVSNIGSLWPTGVLWSSWTGLIYCEFPPASFEEHVGEGGIWVGAISSGDTLVSVTTSWNSGQEFYPSAAPYDTIWVVQKGDTVDIPYWPGYVGVSDQDFVCRYSDYNVTNIGTHKPLYLDVIQTSYAWSSPPLDELIVYNFYVVPTRNNLQKVYIAYWLDGNVGYRGTNWAFALDDFSNYYPQHFMGVSLDNPGGTDGTAYSPIGIKIVPPDNVLPSDLSWTFNWYEGQGGSAPPSRDNLRYLQMSAGVIMKNQNEPVGSQFIVAFGPFDLNVGDTLHFSVGEILGEGIAGVLKNADRLDWLKQNDFKVPSPPPRPPLKVEIANHRVRLDWEARPGEKNPETYTDPYRADSSQVPFEGYRVYKSTQSARGPWTLLAEYDIAGNEFGENTGLARSYTDVGLLNNFEYYYSVTAFSKPDTVSDFPSQESSVNKEAVVIIPGPEPPSDVGRVAVVPNPYRGDIAYHQYNPPWERPDPSRGRWLEQDRRVQFINLPARCEIRIYTLAGDLVRTLFHNNPIRGFEDWNLTSDVGQAVSSGIYLFTVKNETTAEVQTGKFVIIK